jgi:hypothetical protein
MIPLHDCTALGKPDVDPKSYLSLMVCVVKHRRYDARPVLLQDLRAVLRRFIGIKQSAGAGVDIRVCLEPFHLFDEIKAALQSINPASDSVCVAVASFAFTDTPV